MRPWLVPVGGFLGSGKTSLLMAAGGRLRERGHKVAILTNDQAGGLVDTAAARGMSFDAGEVAGACFCCAFTRFVEAAATLAARGADMILAEPVGSCTDIAATVLRPLQQEYGHLFRLAPFTVLVDAAQYSALHAPGADAEVAWLYRQQIAEADILALSKCDLGTRAPELGAPALCLSARTGQGIDDWLEEVLGGRTAPGTRLLADIDYERYARAEARLAWLNAAATVRARTALTPAQLAGPLVEEIDARLTRQGARIAHLKTWTESAHSWLRVSVTENGQEPSVEGDRLAPAAREFRVVVNLRAQGEPEALREAVEEALAALPAEVTMERIDSFRPSPPKPERRA
ncbi:MAG: GTP-binding protein [Bryobacteraceae bacterium]